MGKRKFKYYIIAMIGVVIMAGLTTTSVVAETTVDKETAQSEIDEQNPILTMEFPAGKFVDNVFYIEDISDNIVTYTIEDKDLFLVEEDSELGYITPDVQLYMSVYQYQYDDQGISTERSEYDLWKQIIPTGFDRSTEQYTYQADNGAYEVRWKQVPEHKGKSTITIRFLKESRYQIKIAGKDRAGNILKDENNQLGNGESGSFVNQIAYDLLEPSLEELRIIDEVSAKRPRNGDLISYYNTMEPVLCLKIKEKNVKDIKNSVEIYKTWIDDHGNSYGEERIDPELVLWTYHQNCEFEGEIILSEENNFEDGDYIFRVLYKDLSEKALSSKNIEKLSLTDLTLDRHVPKIIALEVLDTDEYEDLGNIYNGIHYYNSVRKVKLTIEEHNFFDDSEVIDTVGLDYFLSKENWSETSLGSNIYTAVFDMTDLCKDGSLPDGDFTITVGYTDLAGNKAGDVTSEHFIIDTIAPEYEVIYFQGTQTANVKGTDDGRDYYDDEVDVQIEITERNFSSNGEFEMTSRMIAQDIDGNDIQTTASWQDIQSIEAWSDKGNESDKHIISLNFNSDANYTVDFVYQDLAGNTAQDYDAQLTLDRTPPIIDATMHTDIVYNDILHNYNNYNMFKFFDCEISMVSISAHDDISGVDGIVYRTVGADGKEIQSQEEQSLGMGRRDYQIQLPLTSEFKGAVWAWAYDRLSNGSREVVSQGAIIESNEKHEAEKAVTITPSREANANGFYNSDVDIVMSIEDPHIGISQYAYKAGDLSGDNQYSDNADVKDIIYKWSEAVHLVGTNNNSNDVRVKVDYTDNADHTGQAEETYKIDVVKPVVEVNYDLKNPLNDHYFNQTRTATVTVYERNFDERRVDFKWTSTGGSPSISEWTHGTGLGVDDRCIHTATVTFAADADYTFSFSCIDLADNKSEYNRVDSFTVDLIQPVISVIYDNNDAQNEKYYKESRTATVIIEEHNFDSSEVDINITASNDGSSDLVPEVSGWTSSGDVHTATLGYTRDAEYTFDIDYIDLAGNLAENYEKDDFVVDQTAPEISFVDIEDKSANAGEVAPGVEYRDINYDPLQVMVTLEGTNNGICHMDAYRISIINGECVKFSDLEHTKNMDDLYTMTAKVIDKAGNSTEKSILFSVNRFGSVFVLDEETKGFINHYLREEKQVGVTEINVDTIEEQDITYIKDGDVVPMVKDKNYQVSETGTEATWKQYHYTINKENFSAEGHYNVNIYSKDRASNDNSSTSILQNESGDIQFAVDKTAPTCIVTGISHDGRYKAASRIITVDVEDNLALKELNISFNGENVIYGTKDLMEMKGIVNLEAAGTNNWQTLSVRAIDAAGNVSISQEYKFLVSGNIVVQYYMNKPLFYGSIAVLIVGGGLSVVLFAIIRRKRK